MHPPARETCKEELRTLLRFVAQLAAEYGLLRPVVGMVLLDACDSGSGKDWVRHVCGWAGDQDWHRCEFLLFVETNHHDYCRRCVDLLAPAPEEWTRIEPPEPRKVFEVIATAKEKAGNDELQVLLDEMKAAVESDDLRSRTRELFDETTQGATLRDYLDPLHPVVEDFLAAAKKAQSHVYRARGARSRHRDASQGGRRRAGRVAPAP